MKKTLLSGGLLSLALVASFALVGTAQAAAEKTDGFVCPVLSSTVGGHNPNAVLIGGGDYSVIGPNVSVPLQATNADGAGTPGGAHSAPGDSDYSAIWSGQ
jgi:hypothetical protein